jgi:hypothetical protein
MILQYNISLFGRAIGKTEYGQTALVPLNKLRYLPLCTWLTDQGKGELILKLLRIIIVTHIELGRKALLINDIVKCHQISTPANFQGLCPDVIHTTTPPRNGTPRK